MNKIEKIKLKYQDKIKWDLMDYFILVDTTKTHKYLEYMLSMWVEESKDYSFIDLASWVNEFEKLLPYIKNKDIYSKEYRDFKYLIKTIQSATHKKNKNLSTKVKQKEVEILKDTETYTMYFPITHEASIKYGSGTTWCTTQSGEIRTFIRYHKRHLVYIISKKDRRDDYEKVAFVRRNDLFIGTDDNSILIYNASDESVTEDMLLQSGWSEDELFEINSVYDRFIKTRKIKVNENEPHIFDLGYRGYRGVDAELELTRELQRNMSGSTRHNEYRMSDAFSGCTSLTAIPEIPEWVQPSYRGKSQKFNTAEFDQQYLTKQIDFEGVMVGREEMFQQLFRDRQEQKRLQQERQSITTRPPSYKYQFIPPPILGTSSGIEPAFDGKPYYERKVKVDWGDGNIQKKYYMGVDLAKPDSPIHTFIDHVDLLKSEPTPSDRLKKFQEQIEKFAILFREKYKTTIKKWEELPNK